MMRREFALVMALAGSILVTACGGSSDSLAGEGLEGKTITVAFDADSPPFAYVEDGKPAGFDVDVMDEVAKRSGFTLQKSSLPFDGILPSLQANQAQIGAAAISITDEREKVLQFSTPYYQTGIALATKPDNTEVKSVEDLKGRSVAVRTGSSNSLYVEALPFADEIEIHRYNNTNDQLQAVQSGVDDAAVSDGVIFDYYIAQTGKGKLEVRPPLLNTDNYGYAVSKDRDDIKQAIDDALLAWRPTGRTRRSTGSTSTRNLIRCPARSDRCSAWIPCSSSGRNRCPRSSTGRGPPSSSPCSEACWRLSSAAWEGRFWRSGCLWPTRLSAATWRSSEAPR